MFTQQLKITLVKQEQRTFILDLSRFEVDFEGNSKGLTTYTIKDKESSPFQDFIKFLGVKNSAYCSLHPVIFAVRHPRQARYYFVASAISNQVEFFPTEFEYISQPLTIDTLAIK